MHVTERNKQTNQYKKITKNEDRMNEKEKKEKQKERKNEGKKVRKRKKSKRNKPRSKKFRYKCYEAFITILIFSCMTCLLFSYFLYLNKTLHSNKWACECTVRIGILALCVQSFSLKIVSAL